MNAPYCTIGFGIFLFLFFNCGKSRSRTALPGVTALRRGKERRKRKSWQKQRKLESPHTHTPSPPSPAISRPPACIIRALKLSLFSWPGTNFLAWDSTSSIRKGRLKSLNLKVCPVLCPPRPIRGQIAPGACSTSLFFKAEAIGKIKI